MYIFSVSKHSLTQKFMLTFRALTKILSKMVLHIKMFISLSYLSLDQRTLNLCTYALFTAARSHQCSVVSWVCFTSVTESCENSKVSWLRGPRWTMMTTMSLSVGGQRVRSHRINDDCSAPFTVACYTSVNFFHHWEQTVRELPVTKQDRRDRHGDGASRYATSSIRHVANSRDFPKYHTVSTRTTEHW